MSLHSFKEHYLEEAAAETVTINWGRFNPPTIGHEKLLDVSHAKGTGDHRIYATQTTDNKKNPLDWKTKIKYMRKVFPTHARMILMDKKVKTIFDALTIAYKDGYKNIELVVGSDRVKEFTQLINKYNGTKGKHGLYDFASIKVINAGERDPDAEGAEGMSASKMRAAASKNDLVAFTSGLPKKFKDAEGLMNAVRSGMGLKEEKSFRQDVKLKKASNLREKFVAGKLFSVKDKVKTNDGQEGVIDTLGANHVKVKLKESERFKTFWLQDICLNN
jgi:phosphopantetheine adenylyltransferase